MAKRIVWTHTAQKERREILKYWIKHNQSSAYSKKLSKLFRNKVALLQKENYLGSQLILKLSAFRL